MTNANRKIKVPGWRVGLHNDSITFERGDYLCIAKFQDVIGRSAEYEKHGWKDSGEYGHASRGIVADFISGGAPISRFTKTWRSMVDAIAEAVKISETPKKATDTETEVTVEIDRDNDMIISYRGAELVIKWYEWKAIVKGHLSKAYRGTYEGHPLFAEEYFDNEFILRYTNNLLDVPRKGVETSEIILDEIVATWNNGVKTVAGESFITELRKQLIAVLPDYVKSLALGYAWGN